LKDELVRIRLTKDEKELLKKKATERNMSMSDYVKYCTLISPPKFEYKEEEEGFKLAGFEREEEYKKKEK
jgi:hypothetical protein